MKIRTIGRHVRESLKSIVRNGWMTFASVSAVTVTLVLVGVFFILLMNLNQIATSIENDVQIKILVDSTANNEEKNDLEKQISIMNEVESVTFSPKEKELTDLASTFGDDGYIWIDLFKESNPLNDAFIVKTINPEDTMTVAKKLERLDYVSSVRYGQGFVENMFEVLEIARNIGAILIFGLLFTAIFLISNTIKITIVARRKEIEIMRLVGATNGFIRWPFFLEGIWLGILGSIIPIALILSLYKNIYEYLAPRLDGTFITLLDVNPFSYQVSGLLLLLGCVIGVWGSLMSVRKFLKI